MPIEHGIRMSAFTRTRMDGGGNPRMGGSRRSGILNPELLKAGPEAAGLFERSRLRDRMDAIIAHEYEEIERRDEHVKRLTNMPRRPQLPISKRHGRLAGRWTGDGSGRLRRP